MKQIFENKIVFVFNWILLNEFNEINKTIYLNTITVMYRRKKNDVILRRI